MELPLCPCGASPVYRRHAYVSPLKRFEVVVCRHCGLARTWPPPLLPDQMPAFYDEAEDYRERLARRSEWEGFADRILKKLAPVPPGSRLLDVGCNAGLFVNRARAAGFDAYGCDLSAPAIAAGEEALGLEGRLLQGTLADAVRTTGKLQVITYLHCLEHIPDLNQEIREAYDALEAGGKIVIEAPDFLSVWRRLQGGRWYPFSPLQHIWQLDHVALPGLLERHGFTVRLVSTTEDMVHTINWTPKGIMNAGVALVARLLRRGDNLVVIAQKPL